MPATNEASLFKGIWHTELCFFVAGSDVVLLFLELRISVQEIITGKLGPTKRRKVSTLTLL